MPTILKGVYQTAKTAISLDACHVKKLVRIYHYESPGRGDTFCAFPPVFGLCASPQDGACRVPGLFPRAEASGNVLSRLRQGSCGEK
jgi:hypothetical protein